MAQKSVIRRLKSWFLKLILEKKTNSSIEKRRKNYSKLEEKRINKYIIYLLLPALTYTFCSTYNPFRSIFCFILQKFFAPPGAIFLTYNYIFIIPCNVPIKFIWSRGDHMFLFRHIVRKNEKNADLIFFLL